MQTNVWTHAAVVMTYFVDPPRSLFGLIVVFFWGVWAGVRVFIYSSTSISWVNRKHWVHAFGSIK